MFVHNQQQYFLFRKRLCSFVENFVKFSKIYPDKETCFLSASLEMQWNTVKYTQHQRGAGKTKGMTPPFFFGSTHITLVYIYRSLNFEGVAPPSLEKYLEEWWLSFFFFRKTFTYAIPKQNMANFLGIEEPKISIKREEKLTLL